MQNSNWALETTFERLMKCHQVTSNANHDERTRQLNAAERKMLNNFKRYAYAVFKHLPNDNELEEWLALMQHYEVSTRLLDWTYSFYVALFLRLNTWILTMTPTTRPVQFGRSKVML
jgi:hypothetical protein